jgi:hypothetical protein
MVFRFIFPTESWTWRKLGGSGGLTRFWAKRVFPVPQAPSQPRAESRQVRIGFVPVIVESHEFPELQSCTYSTGVASSENHFQGQLNLPGSIRIGGL